MKGILYAFVVLFSINTATAQAPNPVQWAYTAKKIADRTYEIHLTATIQTSWHLYSQNQPSDAIVDPTEIKFNKNPLATFDGAVKEVGKLQLFKDEKLKLSANQYSNKVDFVQVVKLRANVKTNVVGSVRFQTCDDRKCLPPKTIDFTVALN